MKDGRTRLRLIALLNALEEGMLNEPQQAELVKLLQSSDEAQRFYLHFQALSAGLSDYAREGVLAVDESVALPDLAGIPPAASGALTKQKYASALSYVLRHTFTPKRVVVLAAAAAVMLGAIVLILVASGPGDQGGGTIPGGLAIDPPAGRVTPIVLATMIDRDAPLWGGGQRPGSEGFVAGRYRLSEGAVRVRLADGARIKLTAPIDFEITGRNDISITSGELVADVPQQAIGFRVRTPAGDVVDLGTTFGVEVLDDQTTEVQVVDGLVRVAVKNDEGELGGFVELTTMQAARLDGAAESVALTPADRDRFTMDYVRAIDRADIDAGLFRRRAVRRLDVVDIVAGGDGLGSRQAMGIDLASGRFVTNGIMSEKTLEDWKLVAGGARAVQESGVIDSVFVIDPFTGRSVLSSRGDEFTGFPKKQINLQATDNHGFGFIQANRINSIVQPSDSAASISDTYASGDWPRLDGRAFVIHAGAGLTIDLHALGHADTERAAGSFVANVANLEALNRTEHNAQENATADAWVIVDGKPRFTRQSIRTRDGVIKINVDLKAGDRFLTLAVSHGDDSNISHDWVVWEQPRIELWQEGPGF